MGLRTVSFMRVDGSIPRGQIADAKLFDTKKWSYLAPFILIKVEEDDIPAEMWMNGSIHLDLPKLIARYPDKQESYVDEDGKSQKRTIYGYFSELGRSSANIDKQPQLTVLDVEVRHG